MKKTMLKIIGCLILVTGLNAQAGLSSDTVSNAGFDRLTPQQQAKIIKDVADMKDANNANPFAKPDVPTSKVEELNKWVEIGSNIGKGLAGAAKEIGVEVNAFADTKVGQLTMWLIVFHIMGKALLHIGLGFTVWIVGFTVLHIIRKSFWPAATGGFDNDYKNSFIIFNIAVFVAGIIIFVTM